MVEPLQTNVSQQMRQAIAARVQLGIGHGLAGTSHDEGGLQRTEMSMLAGVHGVSNVSMQPEQESRAPAPDCRSCAGCAESTALPSPARQCGRNARGLSAHPA